MWYKISESELLKLLAAYHEFNALSCGGVDNWEWCGASETDYLNDAMKEMGLNPDEIDDFGFYDLAKDDLYNYEQIDG